MGFAKKTKDQKKEKTAKEKQQIKEEFGSMDTDDIKLEFQESVEEHNIDLQQLLKAIKSGRASNDIFDELEVKAYGEMQRFGDLC